MKKITLIVGLLTIAVGVSFAAQDSVCAGKVQKIATDFRFTEGPAWHPDGFIVFSDIPANTIYALKGGEREIYRRPSGQSNGLAFDAQGRLVACEHGNRRVSITRKDGDIEPLVTEYAGKRLNSPNDLAIHSGGAIYFTDPPYGVPQNQRELDFQGVYRIGADGELALLVKDFNRPNGLALSPDESVLYVADTQEDWVRAFDVKEDGTLANGRVLARGENLHPDGMKVDVEGNLYVTGAGGVWVFGPDGEHLETIETPERPANTGFGGPGRRTLYITARTSIYKVRLKNAGATLQYRRKQAEEE